MTTSALSTPNTTSAIGWARVRISLLSISPASPPLMMLSLMPDCDSNCASIGLGKEKEPCTSTRSSCADAAAPSSKAEAATLAVKKEKVRRNIVSILSMRRLRGA